MFKRLRTQLFLAAEREDSLRFHIQMLEAQINVYVQEKRACREKERVAKFEKDLAEHGTAYIEYRLYQSYYKHNAKPQFVVYQADYDEIQSILCF